MIVVGDKGSDAGLEITRQEVVLQQDAVLQGLMPAFDLALCLWVIWRSMNMIHVVIIEPFSQITGYIGRAIVREQPWPMNHIDLIAA